MSVTTVCISLISFQTAQMSGLGRRFDTQPKGNILASVRLSFTAKVQTLLQGLLDIIFVCVNYVKYDRNRSSSGVQDVLDPVSSTLYPAGGEKGGTLASNQQAANLSDRRRDESSGVHLKLTAVVWLCV